ncbi:MAG: gliding motility-associated C-terminal domain-containing protein [Bacteroidales bacterium]|nr:gliding motility-associated C-terminal domain-containing protein [Bacteroidales bacterium]
MNKDKQFDEQIRQDLSQYKSIPPDRCWNRLSSQLDNLPMPQHSVVHSFVSSIAFKVALACVVGAVAVATFFFINQSDKDNQEFDTNGGVVVADTLPMSDVQETVQLSDNNEQLPIMTKHRPILKKDTILDFYTNQSEEVESEKQVEPTLVHDIGETTTENQEPNIKVEKIPTSNQQSEVAKNYQDEIRQETLQDKSSEEDFAIADEGEKTKQPELFIPNIITPNGDGYNDCFEIQGKENTGLNHLIVFTNLGRVVFEQQHYNNNWCGDNLPDNVYYYYFKFTYEGEQYLRKGSITIKR